MTPFFAALAVLFFLVCGFVVYKYGVLHKKFLAFREKSSDRERALYSNIPYFYKNPVEGIDECSLQLRKMLNLDKNLNLDQLREYFRPKNKGMFAKVLNDLNVGNRSVVIFLEDPRSNKKLKCFASRIDEGNGQLASIIMYFEDVTVEISQSTFVESRQTNIRKGFEDLLTILNTSPYPIWQRDESLNVAYANMTHLSMVNDQIRNINDDDALELHHSAKELAARALLEKTPKSERKHVVIDGARRLFKLTEIPVNGKYTVGYALDITDQEKIELVLEKNMSSQSSFLESSRSASAIFGNDKRLMFYNSAFVALWGLDENWLDTTPTYDEILQKLREKRKLPEQADFKEFKNKQLALFSSVIENHEEFLYLPDGKVIRMFVIPHQLGGLIFSYEDITDRLALEQSYNTLAAVKRATIDNLHDGIAVFQEDGRLNLYNPVFANMWQLDPAMLEAHPHVSVLIDETKFLYNYGKDWETYRKEIIRNISSREYMQRRMIRKDGSALVWTSVPLPDGNTLMIYTDITDSYLVEQSLRAEKEALMEADNLKSHFLANVSYELRSPLTSIRGFSEALLQNYCGELNEKQKEYISGIYNSSINLTSLINDILDMASINAGYMTLDVDEYNLSAQVKEMTGDLEAKVIKGGRKFKYSCPEGITILADKKRISQIVSNLVDNAIHATSEGDQIALEVTTTEGNICIAISDNGRGIDTKDIPMIFEQFYKTRTEKDESGTSALSLPIVKSFVELHGGEIFIDSKLGKGTTIKCVFKRRPRELLEAHMLKQHV